MPVPEQDRYQPACLGDEVLVFRILSTLEKGARGGGESQMAKHKKICQLCSGVRLSVMEH